MKPSRKLHLLEMKQGRIIPLTLAVLALLLALRASAMVLYVDLNCTNATPPYTNWTTAATNIQNAVDAAAKGDVVLVTNGVYQTGGRVVFGSLTNRVAINKEVTVQSVNGSAVTVIQGFQVGTNNANNAVRCAYVTNGAALIGFTLTNGDTLGHWPPGAGDVVREESGGGVWCESNNAVVSDCVIVSNNAIVRGGGAYNGTLNNCTLSNNKASLGGGVYFGNPNNCTFVSNTASSYGGGAYSASLTNCLLTGNRVTASSGYGGGAYGGIVSNCTFTRNSAWAGGGAAGISAPVIDCTFISNSASYAGGVYVAGPVVNCIFVGNTAGDGGGAKSGNLYNCSLTANSAGRGGGAYSCTLNNCILTSNTASAGGGAHSSPLNNCTLSGNSASYGGGAYAYMVTLNNCLFKGNYGDYGGAVVGYYGILNHCTLINNSASTTGGGSYGATLNNCVLISNTAVAYGGGASGSTLNNSIVYYNTAPSGSNYDITFAQCALNYCSTMPLTIIGIGNITNEPNFVNLVDGDYHLQSNSPCINSGNNAYVNSVTDLDGNPRIVGGTVDIGAYEYQTPASLLSYAWAQQYGLPTDGSADSVDTDGDILNNWQEWIAGTDPTSAASVLQLAAPSNSISGITVTWQSVNTRTYYLQSSTNLPVFTAIASNLVGQAGTTSYLDTTATNDAPYFYRVGVQ